ncbi:dynactin subunit 2 isoform X2 [Halyomorpha halys]|uniref:dynactin subunit 2 isoform X2 n=1 Tax=Halyomorpha halys TaxID=286706 RepID=UPI0006D51F2D|nr:dynactin subunit 2 isoform X3 [Halyomorpha halys]
MAADPKYANLSGIAYDQPDVYETSDLPEADQFHSDFGSGHFQEEDCDAIEQCHISANDAFSRFKGKFLSSENVDFSDKLTRKPPKGYNARSGEWELVASGDKETPIQRYQRLKCEMKELIEEISVIKEEESKDVNKANMVAHVDSMLRELESLKLEKYLGPSVVNQLADPQGAQIKKLILQLERLSGLGMTSPESTSAATTPGVPTEIRYELKSNPSLAALNHAARVADLEARVSKLQSLVSASPSAIISELYELVKTTEEMSLIIPSVLDRMIALEELHKQGNDFSKSLSELESMQKVLANSCEASKELIKRLEENFATNMKTLQENIDSFSQRMKALQQK